MITTKSTRLRFQLVKSKCLTEVVGDWYFKICSVSPQNWKHYPREWLVRHLLSFEVKIHSSAELCESVKSDKAKRFC